MAPTRSFCSCSTSPLWFQPSPYESTTEWIALMDTSASKRILTPGRTVCVPMPRRFSPERRKPGCWRWKTPRSRRGARRWPHVLRVVVVNVRRCGRGSLPLTLPPRARLHVHALLDGYRGTLTLHRHSSVDCPARPTWNSSRRSCRRGKVGGSPVENVRADAVGNTSRGRLDRIPCQMRIPRGRVNLVVAQ